RGRDPPAARGAPPPPGSAAWHSRRSSWPLVPSSLTASGPAATRPRPASNGRRSDPLPSASNGRGVCPGSRPAISCRRTPLSVRGPAVLALLGRVLGLGLFLGRGDPVEDLLDFLARQRRGRLARPDEARDLGRILDQVRRLVGHLHPDDDVAREELALDLAAL